MWDQLFALFDEFKDDLENLGSVNCRDIFIIANAILKLANERFQELRTHEITNSTLRDLYKLYLITVDDIATSTGLNRTTVSRFLETFSTSFGQEPIADSWPSVYEPLDRSPLLKVSDREWMIHLLPSLLHAIEPNLEAQLARKQAVFQRYEKHRTQYLEDYAINLIAATSKHAKKWSRLRYSFDNGKGLQSFELDGLVTVDNVLFLVEAKSGTMSSPARRGAESAISELKDLVGKAHEQAIRALSYLKSADTVDFLAENGQKIEISLRLFPRIYLITVTLNELAAFTTQLRALRELGVVPKETKAWTICALDLRIIAEIIEGIAMFVDFLDHRLQIEAFDVVAADELDWLGFYLTQGLDLTHVDKEIEKLVFLSFTEPLDDYYYHVSGIRKTPAKKPRRPMSRLLRKLSHQLEQSGPAGFVDAICVLLSVNSKTRRRLTEVIKRARQIAMTNRVSRFAIGLQNGSPMCLCYVCSSDTDRRQIEDYTSAVKYKMKRDHAIGILQNINNPGNLAVTVQDSTWKQDDLLENMADKVLVGTKVVDSNHFR
jgi:hypothetical protein